MTPRQDQADQFDRLRRQAEALINQRSDSGFEATTDILELIHELKIHQAELEIQNEELKRAQLELTDLYRQFEDLYEFAPCGYLNLDPKGLVIRINLAGVMLLNGSRENILHTGFRRLVSPRWQDAYLDALKEAGRTGDRQSLELQLNRAEEAAAWVRADIQADRDKNGAVIQWRMILLDISARKEVESALQGSEKKFRQLFNDMVSGACLLEAADRDRLGHPTDFRFLEVNTAFTQLTGIPRDRAIGRTIKQLWPKTEAIWIDQFKLTLAGAQSTQVEGFHGELGKHFLVSAFRLDNQRIGTTFIDNSAHKRIEETLEKARQDLEVQVSNRTAELLQANKNLQREVVSRKRSQIKLLEKSEELEARKAELEEANIALKVLLKAHEDERKALEDKFVCNINELVRPHLEALAAGQIGPRHRSLVDAIRNSLDDIASPLSRRFIIDSNRLTPVETNIANLIRQGRTTKEIAELMGVATSTVDFHRGNIRTKLGLTHKPINLETHLKSLL